MSKRVYIARCDSGHEVRRATPRRGHLCGCGCGQRMLYREYEVTEERGWVAEVRYKGDPWRWLRITANRERVLAALSRLRAADHGLGYYLLDARDCGCGQLAIDALSKIREAKQLCEEWLELTANSDNPL